MKTPGQINVLRDREKRLRTAVDALAQAESLADNARALRDMAMIVAHLDEGVAPVHLYRDTLGVSRGLFNRLIRRAPEERPEIPEPEKTMVEAAADLEKYTALAAAYREIRDTTMVNMMNGVADDGGRTTPVSNADVARMTGLTTARVAQMRTGTR